MTSPRIEGIERQRTSLWSLGIVLVGALCAALVVLSWTTLDQDAQRQFLQDRWQALVGLSGLVILFGLYATKKHQDLTKLQRQMQHYAVREASLRARLGELSFLFDTSTQLQLRLDMKGMLDLAAQRLLSCFEAHQSSIMLHNPKTGLLEVKAVSGKDSNLVAGSTAKPGEGIAGTVFTSGESQLLNSDVMESRFPNEIKPGRNITSSLSVPMRFRGTTIGVVNICRTDSEEDFSTMHVNMLQSFAEHCAATVTKTRHHQDLLNDVRNAA
jgi:transcriptional regulator with GAF, ATPase, and Fis domain